MSELVARGVVKAYGATQVLGGLDLTVEPGEVVALLGPSGCGKSTLLRVLAGLETADAGTIEERSRPVQGPSPERPMVIQGATLFPWLSVRANIAWGPKALGRSDADAVVDELLRVTDLADFAEFLPRQLSGGMRQRAAIAQVLATEPPVVLLDEPFGALDAQTRLRLQEWLGSLLAERETSAVLVTHDVEEALLLGHRLVRLTQRPARVAETIDVDLPRPRTRSVLTDPSFVALKGRVLAEVLEA